MQIILRYIFFFLSLCLINHSLLLAEEAPYVLVSVAPHKFFVEKIAKTTVQVYLMVPAGASSHTYEPTPRQMLTASKANIWFTIGETFESRAIQALKSYHPSLQIINLQTGLDLIRTDGDCHRGCCPGCVDLHFWLSPRQAQIQAKTIANTLIAAFPEKSDFYQSNLLIFLKELQELDQQIQSILHATSNRQVLVSHPAYGYFCRDYNFQQFAIEIEGKDPTPHQLTKLLQDSKKMKFRTIFIQMQYNNKAAKLIAETLGACLVTLDPYSEEYFASMLEIAHAFARE